MTTADQSAFAVLLRHHRLAAGLSQEQLAERAGLSARAVRALETGERTAPYRETVALLAKALALGPADQQALERVSERQRAPRRPIDFHAPIPATPLPIPLSSFVGRAAEQARLTALLRRPDVRLLTLIGPGGIGKTRLAIEVARALSDDFPEGVVFAGLEAVRDAALVPAAVGHALGMPEGALAALPERLCQLLRPKRLLLVLDNMEQVPDAAPFLAALLGACPHLRLLVTSRAPLRVSGEQEVLLGPLSLPTRGALELTQLDTSDAVRLFVARAKAIRPEFVPTAANAAAVVAICRKLDGLPLAIELAAARLRLLDPGALLAQLDHALALLSGGARDLPVRQRTLRTTLAWSYDLLEPAQQALFRRLGVFAGGCTIEAAAPVAAPGLPKADVLHDLESLLAQSLLQTGSDGRVRMLWVVREFAREQLVAMGEVEETDRRHTDYFLAITEACWALVLQANWAVDVARDFECVVTLVPEVDDLWAAARWLLGHGRAEEGLRLAYLAAEAWRGRGRTMAARAELAVVMALDTEARPTVERGHALFAAVVLAYAQGDALAQRQFCKQWLAVARQLGSGPALAAALSGMGIMQRETGAHEEALAALAESRVLWQALGDREQAAYQLIRQGEVYQARGEVARARAAYEQSAAELGGHGYLTFRLHHHLGSVALEEGDLAAARRWFCRYACSPKPAMGGHRLTALADLVGLAVAERRPGQALRLAGAIDSVGTAMGVRLQPTEHQLLDRWVARARQALTQEEAAAAWQDGQDLTEAEALTEALAGGGQEAPDAPTQSIHG